jgi:hypothetical protein
VAEALLAALAARRSTPRLRRFGEGWTLCLDGEPDCRIEAVDHDPEARAALVAADGSIGRSSSLSSPMGLESLPRREASPLLEAYHDGVATLPPVFGCWAAAALDGPDVAQLEERLDGGSSGCSCPPPRSWTRRGTPAAPRCSTSSSGDPARCSSTPGPPVGPERSRPADAPGWWPALTDYVAQMSTRGTPSCTGVDRGTPPCAWPS